MSHSFTDCFDDEIWDKGLGLYREGRVIRWQSQGNSYRAMVVEDKPYHVEIAPQPLTLHCDCAFAMQGHRCRHMAAAVAAYHAKQENRETSKSPRDAWWDNVTPYLSRNGRINNGKAFTEVVHQYINQSFDVKQSAGERWEAYLSLAEYLMKQATFYYSFDDLIIETLQKAGELRSFLSLTQRQQADDHFLTFCDTCHDPKLCRRFVDAYFAQDEGGAQLAKLVTAHTYDHHAIYANAVFDRMAAASGSKKDLIAFCERNGNEQRLREWAVAYYQKERQYEKGINFLKRCAVRMQKEGLDDSDIQLQLFLFAVLDHNERLQDYYYPIVFHHPAIAKAELFKRMKAVMGKRWETTGKLWMIAALPKLSPKERLEVLAQSDSGDLLIHELLSLQDPHAFLSYWESIYAYDRGIFYYFMYTELCNELDASASLTEAMLALWQKLWKLQEDHQSLLHMLIQCKARYGAHQNILQTLMQLEEFPYE